MHVSAALKVSIESCRWRNTKARRNEANGSSREKNKSLRENKGLKGKKRDTKPLWGSVNGSLCCWTWMIYGCEVIHKLFNMANWPCLPYIWNALRIPIPQEFLGFSFTFLVPTDEPTQMQKTKKEKKKKENSQFWVSESLK